MPNLIQGGVARSVSGVAVFQYTTSRAAVISYAWTPVAAVCNAATASATVPTKIACIAAFTLPAESAVSRRRCASACWSAAGTCRFACCLTASRMAVANAYAIVCSSVTESVLAMLHKAYAVFFAASLNA
jgi:hypothetical protein